MADPVAEFFEVLGRRGHDPLVLNISGTIRFDVLPVREKLTPNGRAIALQQLLQFALPKPSFPGWGLKASPLLGVLVDDDEFAAGLERVQWGIRVCTPSRRDRLFSVAGMWNSTAQLSLRQIDGESE